MPEFSPMTFLEVWDKTVEKHSNEIFLIFENSDGDSAEWNYGCLLYTSPSKRDLSTSRMPSSA